MRVQIGAVLLLVWLVSCRSNNVSPTPRPNPPVTIAAPTQPTQIAQPTQSPIFNPQSPNTPTPNSQPPTPQAPTFAQITTGGCCVQPFFLPDGARVAFLDKPSAEAAAGMYAVPIDAPLSQPTLLTEKLGPFSRDLAYSVDLLGDQTFVERLSDRTKFPINNGGRNVSFSPDATRIVWTVSQDESNNDVRRNDIWLANIDGSEAQRIATRFGGGVVAWFNGSPRMLISGKPNRNDPAPTLAILNLTEGDTQPLYTAERMRGFSLAPDDRHLVFFIAQAQDETLNGLYLLALDEANPQPKKLEFFGAYKWRDGNRLLYIPLKLNQPSQELWQLDVTTGQSQLLIPASPSSPFRVANGDWDVSRDGKHLAYVNAKDRNIWLVNLL